MIYKIYAIQKGITISKSFAFTMEQAQRIAKEKGEVYEKATILISKK